MSRVVRIGTRGSELALRQARWVAERLAESNPGLEPVIEIVKTTGDRVQDRPLDQLGGYGLFTRELDRALLDKRVDVAVHSLKDLPVQQANGLVIAAVPEREDPRDAFIGRDNRGLDQLASGDVVATGSLRRRALLTALRPDLEVTGLRGNIDTRLRKLQESEALAGIILAAAGLNRMGLSGLTTTFLDPPAWLPAPGQGALAIATRADDVVRETVSALDHAPARAAITAERALLEHLGGGCHVPVGAYGFIEGDELRLSGFVGHPDGHQIVRADGAGSPADPGALGRTVGERLLDQGGAAILASLSPRP